MITISRLFSPRVRSSILPVVFAFIITALFSSCAATPQTKKSAEKIVLGDVLVLPFKDMYEVYGKDVSFKCPLCGAVHMVDEVREGADAFLTDLLFSKLKDSRQFNFIGPKQAEGPRNALISGNGADLSEKELVLQTARVLGAESVVVGRVFRFQERIGSSYSVESPASAAFDVLLYRVSDGSLIWSGHFDETQQPLNENLFNLGSFLRRNAKWLKVEELAQDGLSRLLQSFPKPL